MLIIDYFSHDVKLIFYITTFLDGFINPIAPRTAKTLKEFGPF